MSDDQTTQENVQPEASSAEAPTVNTQETNPVSATSEGVEATQGENTETAQGEEEVSKGE